MAISTEEDRTSKFAAVFKGGIPAGHATPARRRRVPRWAIVTVGSLVVLGLGAMTVGSSFLAPASTSIGVLTERVHKADLVVSIAEDGNLESAHNKDIKCEVQGGSTILWLIKDGT